MAETIINSNQLRASGDTSSQTLIGANQIRQSGDSSSQTLLNKNQIAGGGTELYDIEILSQANAQEGWAYICKSARQDLAKASVPTVYDDISVKYSGADTEDTYSTTPTYIGNYCVYNGLQACNDGYLYSTGGHTNDWKLTRTRIDKIQNGERKDWEALGTTSQVVKLAEGYPYRVGTNLICSVEKDTNNVVRIYKKSDMSIIRETSLNNTNNTVGIYLLKINGKDTFILSYGVTADGSTKYHIDMLEDVANPTIVDCGDSFSNFIKRPVYIESENKLCFSMGSYIYKADTDFSNMTQKVSGSTHLYRIGSTIITSPTLTYPTKTYKRSLDNGENWSNVTSGFMPNTTIHYCDGSKFYGFDYNDKNIYTSTDLVNFTLISSITSGNRKSFTFVQDTVIFTRDYEVYYIGKNKKIYTDDYTIEGNTVSINYYKNGDFKICVPDTTNDTNLESVYASVGHYDYFRLDTTNQTVSLPRQSTLYSAMYVSDDYRDTY